MALVAVAYTAGASVSWLLLEASSTAVFFPPAGVTVAALLLTEPRRWVWILLAAGAAEMMVDLSQGQSAAVAMGFSLANTAEPLVGAILVRRWRPGRLDLTRRGDAAAFLLGAVLTGPLAGAAIGASTIALGLGRNWWTGFGQFWAGDALAVLTLGAALVSALGTAHEPLRLISWRRAGLGPLVLVLLGTAALTVVGFWPRHAPIVFLPALWLVVVAVRGQVTLLAAAGFVMACTANLVSGTGHGPWVLARGQGAATAALQLYLGSVVLATAVLALEIAARSRAEESSRKERVARVRLQSLHDVTAGLSAAPDSARIARVLIDSGLSLVADYGVVGLIDPDNEVVRTWTTDNFPAQVAERLGCIPFDDASSFPIAQAALSGQTITMASMAEIGARFPHVVWTHAETGTRSLMVIPVGAAGHRVGALAFGFATEGTPDHDVLSMAHTLAEAAGLAWERARLYDLEYDASHQLQHMLLPDIARTLPGVQVAVHYQPADAHHDVGGDWYDAFQLPDGRVGLAVGDVVGHDLHAAIAMGRLQTGLRILAPRHPHPGAVLEALDEVAATTAGAELATIGYADYDPATATLRYACAGHLPPLLVTATAANYLWEGRSTPMTLALDRRPSAQVTVPPGATLIWYTDGLIERRREDIDLGLERLRRLGADLGRRDTDADPATWCRRILAGLTGNNSADDDLAIVCVRLGVDTRDPGQHSSRPARSRPPHIRPATPVTTSDAESDWSRHHVTRGTPSMPGA